MAKYEEILTILPSIVDEDYDITILSNASALLNIYVEDISWVGFYLLKGQTLLLGPFQGKPARSKINIGNGLCGKCAKEEKTLIIKNIADFKGLIGRDANSKSEICLPIYNKDGNIYGVLDIDSPVVNRFGEIDKIYLEKIVNIIENALSEQKIFDL